MSGLFSSHILIIAENRRRTELQMTTNKREEHIFFIVSLDQTQSLRFFLDLLIKKKLKLVGDAN